MKFEGSKAANESFICVLMNWLPCKDWSSRSSNLAISIRSRLDMNLVQYIVHNLEIANRWILNHAIVACVSNVAWVASNFLMSGWPNSVSLHTRTRRSFGGQGPNLQCLNLLGEGTMRVVSTEEGHCGWHKVPWGHAINHISANVRNGQFHVWSSGFLQKR